MGSVCTLLEGPSEAGLLTAQVPDQVQGTRVKKRGLLIGKGKRTPLKRLLFKNLGSQDN